MCVLTVIQVESTLGYGRKTRNINRNQKRAVDTRGNSFTTMSVARGGSEEGGR